MYYTRVVEAQPDFFLGGIAEISAYAVTPDGRLTLTRPTPLVVGGIGAWGQRNVQAQLAIMRDWVRNLDPTDALRHADASRALDQLMETLERR